jgi:hypothetical protein
MENKQLEFPEVREPVPAQMLGYDEQVIANGLVMQTEGKKYFVSDQIDTSDDRYRHAAFVRTAQGTFHVRAINIAPETQRIELQF